MGWWYVCIHAGCADAGQRTSPDARSGSASDLLLATDADQPVHAIPSTSDGHIQRDSPTQLCQRGTRHIHMVPPEAFSTGLIAVNFNGAVIQLAQ